jgi:hypothetical protein
LAYILDDVSSDFCQALAEGEGLYNCDNETAAAVGYQWKFEFNVDHVEVEIGAFKVVQGRYGSARHRMPTSKVTSR